MESNLAGLGEVVEVGYHAELVAGVVRDVLAHVVGRPDGDIYPPRRYLPLAAPRRVPPAAPIGRLAAALCHVDVYDGRCDVGGAVHPYVRVGSRHHHLDKLADNNVEEANVIDVEQRF